MDYIQLLRELESQIPTTGEANHNITLSDEGEPQINVLLEEDQWMWVQLEDEDKQKDPAVLAEEIANAVSP